MDGLVGRGEGRRGRDAAGPAGAQGTGDQTAQAKVAGSAEGGVGDGGTGNGCGVGAGRGAAIGGAGNARADYEAALKERDEMIAALEGETAGSAERLCKEMDELRCQGDEQRIGLELQMAVPQRQNREGAVRRLRQRHR